MIRSFACDETEDIFYQKVSPKFPYEIQRRAHMKLMLIHGACQLGALRVPSSNRLEALKGNRKGQYSIRINDQYRICFRWVDGNAEDVEIIDYH